MTETKQADEHGTPLERLHWCAAPHITREYRSVTFGEADAKALVHELQSGLIPADWQPTPEAINALPEPLRAYIHRIETSHPSYDNAVRIRQLEEQVEQLQAALGEAERDSERLDWLGSGEDRDCYVGMDDRWTVQDGERMTGGDTLREAIDDAMAAGEDAK